MYSITGAGATELTASAGTTQSITGASVSVAVETPREAAQRSRPGAHGATRIGTAVQRTQEARHRKRGQQSMLTARFRHQKETTKVVLEPKHLQIVRVRQCVFVMKYCPTSTVCKNTAPIHFFNRPGCQHAPLSGLLPAYGSLRTC